MSNIISYLRTNIRKNHPFGWLNIELVRGDMKCLHEIEAEICRWEDILHIDYVRYLRGELDIYPIEELHLI